MSIGMGVLTVYIVDSDASVRKGLGRLMHSAGHRTAAFDSSEAFLGADRAPGAGCLVMDISMMELADPQHQALLNRKRAGLPMIATSSRDDEDIRSRARLLDAQFFLRKPVDAQALLDAIEWVKGPGRHPG